MPLTRAFIPMLVFVLVVLILYGVLFLLINLPRFDANAHIQESVRVIQ